MFRDPESYNAKPGKKLFVARERSSWNIVPNQEPKNKQRRHYPERSGRKSSTFAAEFQRKKHIPEKTNFQHWDFLKPEIRERPRRMENQPPQFRGGFFRRSAQQIQPYKERRAQDEMKEEKKEVHRQRRCEYIEKNNAYNGNPINHQPPKYEKKTADNKPRGRKFYNQHHQTETLKRESYLRSRSGRTRYHHDDPNKRATKLQQRAQRLKQMNRTSSAIGYGRGDIKSYGVLDNFLGYGSGDIVTAKPKGRKRAQIKR